MDIWIRSRGRGMVKAGELQFPFSQTRVVVECLAVHCAGMEVRMS